MTSSPQDTAQTRLTYRVGLSRVDRQEVKTQSDYEAYNARLLSLRLGDIDYWLFNIDTGQVIATDELVDSLAAQSGDISQRLALYESRVRGISLALAYNGIECQRVAREVTWTNYLVDYGSKGFSATGRLRKASRCIKDNAHSYEEARNILRDTLHMKCSQRLRASFRSSGWLYVINSCFGVKQESQALVLDTLFVKRHFGKPI